LGPIYRVSHKLLHGKLLSHVFTSTVWEKLYPRYYFYWMKKILATLVNEHRNSYPISRYLSPNFF
jgi:hypothetical protein